MPRCPIVVMKKIEYPARSSLIDAIGNLYVVLTPGGPFVCCDIMKTLMSRFVLVLGLSFFVVQSTYAENSEAHPVKDLSNANQLIRWPKGFDPKDADAFVHNDIWIKAPANVIWANLVNAPEWPTWYSNSSDVRILGDDTQKLQENSRFTWKTFGFAVDSHVYEFVPESRIAWFGDGTGIRAYHAWLIVEKGDGCEVITEETQNGPSAVKLNTEKPTGMYDGHELWLNALKARSEQATSNQG